MSLLEQELHQTRPFGDSSLETILAVLKSGDLIERQLEETLSEHGLTLQQYHVLRILRSAGPRGLPVLDIARGMIEDSPNVTRLVDRLALKGLASRHRSQADRRVVYARLTEAGEALLAAVQAPVHRTQRDICGHLTQGEIDHLNRLLEKMRRAVYERR